MIVDDLTCVPEIELLLRDLTALARMTLFVLRAVRVSFDPAHIAEWASELERTGAAGTEAIALLLRYLSEVDGGDAIREALLDAIESAEVREVAMGLRKDWEDRARAEGELKGRIEGRAEVLLKLLRLKFGELPAPSVDRVRAASPDELDRWVERVLTASTLDEALG